MASTTYLELTNKLLRRLNEVEIAQSDFASVRGVQSLAKDMIQAAINEINMQEFEWPFNAATYTQTLTVGTEEYAFVDTIKSVDWDSFYLVADDALDVFARPLLFIAREARNRFLKVDDDNAGADGINAPTYVYKSHTFGFGISPSPDEAYTVTFDYFLKPVQLTDYDDTSTVPEIYDEVIIQAALFHFYMFRDNSEQAQIAKQNFRQLLNRMRSILLNDKDDRIRSTQVIRKGTSGGVWSNDYFRW